MTQQVSYANDHDTISTSPAPCARGGREHPAQREHAVPVAAPALARSIAEEDTASRYLHDMLLGTPGQAAATGQEQQAGARPTVIGCSTATRGGASCGLRGAAVAAVRDEQRAAKEHLDLMVVALECGALRDATAHLERARIGLLQLSDDLGMLRPCRTEP